MAMARGVEADQENNPDGGRRGLGGVRVVSGPGVPQEPLGSLRDS